MMRVSRLALSVDFIDKSIVPQGLTRVATYIQTSVLFTKREYVLVLNIR